MRVPVKIAFAMLLAAAPSAAWGSDKGRDSACGDPEVRAHVKGAACVAAKNGFVLGDASDIAGLAKVIDEAAERFKANLGMPVAPIAVVATGQLATERYRALKGRGYVVLPWLTGSARRRMQESGIGLELRTRFKNMPKEQVDALVAQAIAQMPKGNKPAADALAVEAGGFAHELAHGWFRHFYDGEARAAPGERRYGSSAPDWLDEMAAVLTENEVLTEARRRELPMQVAGKKLFPLKEYFSMAHPMLGAATAGQAPTGHMRVALLTGKEAEGVIAKSAGASAFYVQSRALADFLIGRSGNPKLVLELATHVRNGGSMESWLASRGKDHRLPASVEALDAQWEHWLAERAA